MVPIVMSLLYFRGQRKSERVKTILLFFLIMKQERVDSLDDFIREIWQVGDGAESLPRNFPVIQRK